MMFFQKKKTEPLRWGGLVKVVEKTTNDGTVTYYVKAKGYDGMGDPCWNNLDNNREWHEKRNAVARAESHWGKLVKSRRVVAQ